MSANTICQRLSPAPTIDHHELRPWQMHHHVREDPSHGDAKRMITSYSSSAPNWNGSSESWEKRHASMHPHKHIKHSTQRHTQHISGLRQTNGIVRPSATRSHFQQHDAHAARRQSTSPLQLGEHGPHSVLLRHGAPAQQLASPHESNLLARHTPSLTREGALRSPRQNQHRVLPAILSSGEREAAGLAHTQTATPQPDNQPQTNKHAQTSLGERSRSNISSANQTHTAAGVRGRLVKQPARDSPQRRRPRHKTRTQHSAGQQPEGNQKLASRASGHTRRPQHRNPAAGTIKARHGRRRAKRARGRRRGPGQGQHCDTATRTGGQV